MRVSFLVTAIVVFILTVFAVLLNPRVVYAQCGSGCRARCVDDGNYGCWWECECDGTFRCQSGDPSPPCPVGGPTDCGPGCGWGPTGCFCCDPHRPCEAGGCCGGGATPTSGPGGTPGPTGQPTSPPGNPTNPPPGNNVNVKGRVYDDPAQTATLGLDGQCNGPTADPIRPSGSSKVRVDPDGREDNVGGDGKYKVQNVHENGLKNITLLNIGSYQCACPNGCLYNGVTVSGGNNNGWDFFVSNIPARWYKVFGGHVHSQGNLTDQVPSGNVLIADASGDGPGALTRTSGSSVSLGSGSLSSNTNWDKVDTLSSATWKYGYQTMWIRAGSPTTDPGNGSSPPAAGVFRKTGNYTVSGTWTNLSGSRVIFVQGDVVIGTNITLSGNAFLAVIASGNISVDATVGNATSQANPTASDATISGAFLADGNFQGGTTGLANDKQLVVYGTVAADADLNGVGSVFSQRSLGINNTKPAVAYVWNPFLVLNAPDQLKDALTDWREVAP